MDEYRVKPGDRVELSKLDPNDTGKYKEKEEAQQDFDALNGQLEQLQELLYAEHRQKILVILQAMDTGGKDGVIRHVFEGVNPAGVRVASFKVPSAIEMDHDYLWRVHAQTPGRGELVIFNRSHYEDVLVVRVHNLVKPEVWSRRYEQINAFEKLLVEEGTTILKFYLHIDKNEQKRRLQDRLDDPSKLWKFNPGDLKERALWPDYQKAYEDVLERTSTHCAPWHIVPANKKWYRNLVVAKILVDTLKSLKMEYPQPAEDLSNLVID